jgi:hypothetical protein
VHPDTKTLTTHGNGGRAGTVFRAAKYIVENNCPVPVITVTQDWDMDKKQYHCVIEQRRGGKLSQFGMSGPGQKVSSKGRVTRASRLVAWKMSSVTLASIPAVLSPSTPNRRAPEKRLDVIPIGPQSAIFWA